MDIRKTQVIDITDTTAKVIWETDDDTTTEFALWKKNSSGRYIPIAIGRVTGDGNMGITKNHVFNLVNLTSNTVYRVEAKSYNENTGDYATCKDSSSPSEFITLAAQQPVVRSVSVTFAKQRIAVGESTDIIEKVLDSNSATMQKINVNFYATGAFS